MMKMKNVCGEFIAEANKFTVPPLHAIKAKFNTNKPIIPVNRWTKTDEGQLTKTFLFRRLEDKVEFVNYLLETEEDEKHPVRFEVSHGKVLVFYWSVGMNFPTEIDKEHAEKADQAFKDIVYRPEKI